MSKGFNLTAEINLRGPSNIRTVVADIRRQIGSVSADITPVVTRQSVRNVASVIRSQLSNIICDVKIKANTSSLRSIGSDIRRQLSGVSANINVRANQSSIRTMAADIRRQLGSINANVNVRFNTTAVTTYSNNLRGLNANLNQIITSATNATGAINALAAAMRSASAAGSAINNTAINVGNVSRAANNTRNSITLASNEMVEFGRQSGLAFRRFSAITTVTSVIYGLTNAVSQGVKSFIDFDLQMTRISQVTGDSRNKLADVANTITDLSTKLGVSSNELTTTTVTLAQAGLTAKDTATALKALALSALAPSFDDMNQTVEGSIALMRQFGIGANQLEMALGSVNAVSAKFAVEASDIITAIQRTGGVFAAASRGVSTGTEALNEFIAVFTSIRATTRESAETIATGLRTIFTRIQRAGTIEALQEFGVTLTDLEGKFVGPYIAVQRLSEGLSRLDPRDLKFSQIVEELGGFRQIGKVLPLIQQFATAQDALKVAQQGQGSLATDAAKGQLALAIQIQKVREEFLALIRSIGDTSSFQNIVKVGLDLASALIKVADATKGVLPLLTLFAAFKGITAATQYIGGFSQGIRGNGGGARRANEGGRIYAFASGGLVPGYGNGDTVSAKLTPGEFVMSKPAAQSIGVGNLHSLNRSRGGSIFPKNYYQGGVAALKSLSPGESGNRISDYIDYYENETSKTSKQKTGRKNKLNRQSPKMLRGFQLKDNVNSDIERRVIGESEIKEAVANNANFRRYINSRAAKDKSREFYAAQGVAFEEFLFQHILEGKQYEKAPKNNYPLDFIPKTPGLPPVEAKFTYEQVPDAFILNKRLRYNLLRRNNEKISPLTRKQKPDNIQLGPTIVYEMGPGLKNKIFTPNSSESQKRGREERAQKSLLKIDKLGLERNNGGSIQKFGIGGSTDAISTYKATSMKLNRSLMLGTPLTKEEQKNVKDLKKQTTDKLPKQLYSGIGENRLNLIKNQVGDKLPKSVGKSFTLPGFLSTSLDSSIAMEFARQGLLSILTNPKKKGINTNKRVSTDYDLEKEFILPPNSKFKILSAKEERSSARPGSSLMRSKASLNVQQLASGGSIQRFMAGEMVRRTKKERFKKITESDAAKLTASQIITGLTTGQTGPVRVEGMDVGMMRTILGKRNTTPDIQRKKDEILKAYTRRINGEVDQRLGITNQKQAAGLLFGIAGLYGSPFKPTDMVVGDKGELKNITTVQVMGGVPRKKLMDKAGIGIDDLDAYGKDFRKSVKKGAKRLLVSDILSQLGLGKALYADFDKTLVFGADNLPDLQSFNNKRQVGRQLLSEKARLSTLGQKLRDLLLVKPQLSPYVNVLTARPPSTVGLLQAFLKRQNLNIPRSQFTGVGGNNLNESAIAKLKAAELPPGSVFVDDNGKNTKEAELKSKSLKAKGEAGIKVFRYKSARNPLDQPGEDTAAGLAFQESLRGLLSDKRAMAAFAETGGKSIDFPLGLGKRAALFGLKPNIPTDAKRTLNGPSTAKDNITNYLKVRGYNSGGIIQKFETGGATDSLRQYQLRSKDLHSAVISNKPDKTKSNQIKDLDSSMIDSLPKILYSGFKENRRKIIDQDIDPNKDYKSQLMNKTFSFPSFLSTSINYDSAKRFAGSNGGVLHIRPTGKGANVLERTGNKGKSALYDMEAEYLLPRNSRFKINRVLDTTGPLGWRSDWGAPNFLEAEVKSFKNGGNIRRFADAGLVPAPKLIQRGGFKYSLEDIIKAGFTEAQFMKQIPAPGGYGEQWQIGGYGEGSIPMPPSLQPYKAPPSVVQDRVDLARSNVQNRMADAVRRDGRTLRDYEVSSDQKAFKKMRGYAIGGSTQDTVPALVSNGEAFVPPETAKNIGYDKLREMNQADRNGMRSFAGGGISLFKGPGSGTSDSIGPVGLPVGGFVIRAAATKALGLSKGGAVQRFAFGGSPRAVPNISGMSDARALSVVGVTDNVTGQLENLATVLQELGVRSGDSARIIQSGIQATYQQAIRATEADIRRARLAGASAEQISQAENQLADIRRQAQQDIQTRRTLGGLSGNQLQSIESNAQEERDRIRTNTRNRLAARGMSQEDINTRLQENAGAIDRQAYSRASSRAGVNLRANGLTGDDAQRFVRQSMGDPRILRQMDDQLRQQLRSSTAYTTASRTQQRQMSQSVEEEIRTRKDIVNKLARQRGQQAPGGDQRGNFGGMLGLSFGLQGIGSLLAQQINASASSSNASTAGAIQGGVTGLATGGMLVGGLQDMLGSRLSPAVSKLLGGFGLLATLAASVGQAFIEARNAAIEFEKNFQQKKLETAISDSQQLFEKLNTNIKNVDIQRSLASKLAEAGEAAKAGIEANNKLAKAFWVNLFDAFGSADQGAASQRSEILDKKGIMAYFRSTDLFGGGDKGRSKEYQSLIPEKARENSKSFAETSKLTTDLIGAKIQSGSSVEDIFKDPAWKKQAEVIARANAAVEQEILSIKNNANISDVEKEARINNIIAINAEQTIRQQASVIERQQQLKSLDNTINVYTRSLERMFQNMEQSIGRASFSLEQMSKDIDLASDSLQGQAKVGNIALTAINALQNPRAYSDQTVSNSRNVAAESFGIRSPEMVSLLGVGEKIESTVMSTINKSVNKNPGITEEALGSIVGRDVKEALANLSLPPDLVEKLSGEVGNVLKDFKKSGDEKLDYTQLSEKLGQLNKVVDSSRRAQEVAIKALEHYQNALNVYTQNINKTIDLQISANQRLRKATDIVADSELSLAKTLGKNISLENARTMVNSKVSAKTGGATNPNDIFDSINKLENTRVVQQAEQRSAGERGLSGQADFIKFTKNLSDTNIGLRENIDALKYLADNTDIAASAMEKIQEAQQKSSGRASFIEKLVTSTPEELNGLSSAFQRLQNNANGQINTINRSTGAQRAYYEALQNGASMMEAMKAAQAAFVNERKETLGALNDILPFLGNNQQAGNIKANVLESMLQESGMGVSPVFQQILNTLRNPELDPATQAAIAEYREGNNLQARANSLLAQLDSNLARDIANQSAKALANALSDVKINFEGSELKDLVNLVQQINGKLPLGAAPAAGKASGGVIYAAAGRAIDFKSQGTDTVPAMLTPGEFVVNRAATQSHLPLLNAINSNKYSSGGAVRYYSSGGYVSQNFKEEYKKNSDDLVQSKEKYIDPRSAAFREVKSVYAGPDKFVRGAQPKTIMAPVATASSGRASLDSIKSEDGINNLYLGEAPAILVEKNAHNQDVFNYGVINRPRAHLLDPLGSVVDKPFDTKNITKNKFIEYKNSFNQKLINSDLDSSTIVSSMPAVNDIKDIPESLISDQFYSPNVISNLPVGMIVTRNKTLGALSWNKESTEHAKVLKIYRLASDYADVSVVSNEDQGYYKIKSDLKMSDSSAQDRIKILTGDNSWITEKDNIKNIIKTQELNLKDLKQTQTFTSVDPDPTNPVFNNLFKAEDPNLSNLRQKLEILYSGAEGISLTGNELNFFNPSALSEDKENNITLLHVLNSKYKPILDKSLNSKQQADKIKTTFPKLMVGGAGLNNLPDADYKWARGYEFGIYDVADMGKMKTFPWVANEDPSVISQDIQAAIDNQAEQLKTKYGISTKPVSDFGSYKLKLPNPIGDVDLPYHMQYTEYTGPQIATDPSKADPNGFNLGANLNKALLITPNNKNPLSPYSQFKKYAQSTAYVDKILTGDEIFDKSHIELDKIPDFTTLAKGNIDRNQRDQLKQNLKGVQYSIDLDSLIDHTNHPILKNIPLFEDSPPNKQSYVFNIGEYLSTVADKVFTDRDNAAIKSVGEIDDKGQLADDTIKDNKLPDAVKNLARLSLGVFGRKRVPGLPGNWLYNSIRGIIQKPFKNSGVAQQAAGYTSGIFNNFGGYLSKLAPMTRNPNIYQQLKELFTLGSGAAMAFTGLASGDTRMIGQFQKLNLNAEDLFRSLGGASLFGRISSTALSGDYKAILGQQLEGAKIKTVGANGTLSLVSADKAIPEKYNDLVNIAFNPYNEFPSKDTRKDIIEKLTTDMINATDQVGMSYFDPNTQRFLYGNMTSLYNWYGGNGAWEGQDYFFDKNVDPDNAKRTQQVIDSFSGQDGQDAYTKGNIAHTTLGFASRYGSLPTDKWFVQRREAGLNAEARAVTDPNASKDPLRFATGGVVYAQEGQHINFQPRGTDTVPAMLTPGEFVINKAATQSNLPLLHAINNGGAKAYSNGGPVYLARGGLTVKEHFKPLDTNIFDSLDIDKNSILEDNEMPKNSILRYMADYRKGADNKLTKKELEEYNTDYDSHIDNYLSLDAQKKYNNINPQKQKLNGSFQLNNGDRISQIQFIQTYEAANKIGKQKSKWGARNTLEENFYSGDPNYPFSQATYDLEAHNNKLRLGVGPFNSKAFGYGVAQQIIPALLSLAGGGVGFALTAPFTPAAQIGGTIGGAIVGDQIGQVINEMIYNGFPSSWKKDINKKIEKYPESYEIGQWTGFAADIAMGGFADDFITKSASGLVKKKLTRQAIDEAIKSGSSLNKLIQVGNDTIPIEKTVDDLAESTGKEAASNSKKVNKSKSKKSEKAENKAKIDSLLKNMKIIGDEYNSKIGEAYNKGILRKYDSLAAGDIASAIQKTGDVRNQAAKFHFDDLLKSSPDYVDPSLLTKLTDNSPIYIAAQSQAKETFSRLGIDVSDDFGKLDANKMFDEYFNKEYDILSKNPLNEAAARQKQSILDEIAQKYDIDPSDFKRLKDKLDDIAVRPRRPGFKTIYGLTKTAIMIARMIKDRKIEQKKAQPYDMPEAQTVPAVADKAEAAASPNKDEPKTAETTPPKPQVVKPKDVGNLPKYWDELSYKEYLDTLIKSGKNPEIPDKKLFTTSAIYTKGKRTTALDSRDTTGIVGGNRVSLPKDPKEKAKLDAQINNIGQKLYTSSEIAYDSYSRLVTGKNKNIPLGDIIKGDLIDNYRQSIESMHELMSITNLDKFGTINFKLDKPLPGQSSNKKLGDIIDTLKAVRKGYKNDIVPSLVNEDAEPKEGETPEDANKRTQRSVVIDDSILDLFGRKFAPITETRPDAVPDNGKKFTGREVSDTARENDKFPFRTRITGAKGINSQYKSAYSYYRRILGEYNYHKNIGKLDRYIKGYKTTATVARTLASGGIVYASTGALIPYAPKGTDTVPAMLTPGEFVVNARSTAKNLPLLKSINNGGVQGLSSGGVAYLSRGGQPNDVSYGRFELSDDQAQFSHRSINPLTGNRTPENGDDLDKKYRINSGIYDYLTLRTTMPDWLTSLNNLSFDDNSMRFFSDASFYKTLTQIREANDLRSLQSLSYNFVKGFKYRDYNKDNRLTGFDFTSHLSKTDGILGLIDPDVGGDLQPKDLVKWTTTKAKLQAKSSAARVVKNLTPDLENLRDILSDQKPMGKNNNPEFKNRNHYESPAALLNSTVSEWKKQRQQQKNRVNLRQEELTESKDGRQITMPPHLNMNFDEINVADVVKDILAKKKTPYTENLVSWLENNVKTVSEKVADLVPVPKASEEWDAADAERPRVILDLIKNGPEAFMTGLKGETKEGKSKSLIYSLLAQSARIQGINNLIKARSLFSGSETSVRKGETNFTGDMARRDRNLVYKDQTRTPENFEERENNVSRSGQVKTLTPADNSAIPGSGPNGEQTSDERRETSNRARMANGRGNSAIRGIELWDTNRDGKISFEEWNQFRPEKEPELQRFFGASTFDALMGAYSSALKGLGLRDKNATDNFKPRTLKDYFKNIDKDNTGYIEQHEFSDMVGKPLEYLDIETDREAKELGDTLGTQRDPRGAQKLAYDKIDRTTISSVKNLLKQDFKELYPVSFSKASHFSEREVIQPQIDALRKITGVSELDKINKRTILANIGSSLNKDNSDWGLSPKVEENLGNVMVKIKQDSLLFPGVVNKAYTQGLATPQDLLHNPDINYEKTLKRSGIPEDIFKTIWQDYKPVSKFDNPNSKDSLDKIYKLNNELNSQEIGEDKERTTAAALSQKSNAKKRSAKKELTKNTLIEQLLVKAKYFEPDVYNKLWRGQYKDYYDVPDPTLARHVDMYNTLIPSGETGRLSKPSADQEKEYRNRLKDISKNPIYANKGMLIPYQPRGTDTVPAMLTPGEFVINRAATQQNLPLLHAINSGAKTYSSGGIVYAANGDLIGSSNSSSNSDLSKISAVASLVPKILSKVKDSDKIKSNLDTINNNVILNHKQGKILNDKISLLNNKIDMGLGDIQENIPTDNYLSNIPNYFSNNLSRSSSYGLNHGGIVYAANGKLVNYQPQGTDTIPAMLTPGEFVVNARATSANLPLLQTINKSKGGIAYLQQGGLPNNRDFLENNRDLQRFTSRIGLKAARDIINHKDMYDIFNNNMFHEDLDVDAKIVESKRYIDSHITDRSKIAARELVKQRIRQRQRYLDQIFTANRFTLDEISFGGRDRELRYTLFGIELKEILTTQWRNAQGENYRLQDVIEGINPSRPPSFFNNGGVVYAQDGFDPSKQRMPTLFDLPQDFRKPHKPYKPDVKPKPGLAGASIGAPEKVSATTQRAIDSKVWEQTPQDIPYWFGTRKESETERQQRVIEYGLNENLPEWYKNAGMAWQMVENIAQGWAGTGGAGHQQPRLMQRVKGSRTPLTGQRPNIPVPGYGASNPNTLNDLTTSNVTRPMVRTGDTLDNATTDAGLRRRVSSPKDALQNASTNSMSRPKPISNQDSFGNESTNAGSNPKLQLAPLSSSLGGTTSNSNVSQPAVPSSSSSKGILGKILEYIKKPFVKQQTDEDPRMPVFMTKKPDSVTEGNIQKLLSDRQVGYTGSSLLAGRNAKPGMLKEVDKYLRDAGIDPSSMKFVGSGRESMVFDAGNGKVFKLGYTQNRDVQNILKSPDLEALSLPSDVPGVAGYTGRQNIGPYTVGFQQRTQTLDPEAQKQFQTGNVGAEMQKYLREKGYEWKDAHQGNVGYATDPRFGIPTPMGSLQVIDGDVRPIQAKQKGGMIYASQGTLVNYQPRGTDTVPAMLTPGEFVVNAQATRQNLPLLQSINKSKGGVIYSANGGLVGLLRRKNVNRMENKAQSTNESNSWIGVNGDGKPMDKFGMPIDNLMDIYPSDIMLVNAQSREKALEDIQANTNFDKVKDTVQKASVLWRKQKLNLDENNNRKSDSDIVLDELIYQIAFEPKRFDKNSYSSDADDTVLAKAKKIMEEINGTGGAVPPGAVPNANLQLTNTQLLQTQRVSDRIWERTSYLKQIVNNTQNAIDVLGHNQANNEKRNIFDGTTVDGTSQFDPAAIGISNTTNKQGTQVLQSQNDWAKKELDYIKAVREEIMTLSTPEQRANLAQMPRPPEVLYDETTPIPMRFNRGGVVYAQDGFDASKLPINKNKGGIIYASQGTLVNYQPRGTDTVPAMLTPGEFVVNAKATSKNLSLLQSINNGVQGYSNGGVIDPIYRPRGGYTPPRPPKQTLEQRQQAYQDRRAAEKTAREDRATARKNKTTSYDQMLNAREEAYRANVDARADNNRSPLVKIFEELEKQVNANPDKFELVMPGSVRSALDEDKDAKAKSEFYEQHFMSLSPEDVYKAAKEMYLKDQRQFKYLEGIYNRSKQALFQFSRYPAIGGRIVGTSGKTALAILSKQVEAAHAQGLVLDNAWKILGQKHPEFLAQNSNRQNAAGHASGGIIYANNGMLIPYQPRGSDTVPAMLTPGEFVVNKQAAQNNLDLLQQINSKKYNQGGHVVYKEAGGPIQLKKPIYRANGGMTDETSGGGGGVSNNKDMGLNFDGLSQFTATFGKFIQQLNSLKLPEVINIQGNHKVDVVINGAGALQGMQEGIRNMIVGEVNKAMSSISKQTDGAIA